MFTFFAHLKIQLNLDADDNLITPTTYIVGYIRGTLLIVCSGDALHPKECYPNGARKYKEGDVIEFSWRMSGVTGILIYAIVPSG